MTRSVPIPGLIVGAGPLERPTATANVSVSVASGSTATVSLGERAAGRRKVRALQAVYDAAQTGRENTRHWASADLLSANSANSAAIRQTLRSRARYEVANNSYARGMVHSLARYVVGTGPRLQMLTDDLGVNRKVEREFFRWARAVGLPAKLRTMRVSQAESGESFAVLVNNPVLPTRVKLDFRLIEADQVATPFMAVRAIADPNIVDGIEFDAHGNPSKYTVLKQHPGDNATIGAAPNASGEVDAANMLHLFRQERPGQARGIPEITAALPLYALLRRYTLAVVMSAENAALPAGVIYTDAPGEESDEVDPLDQVEFDRSTWLTMPAGWKIGQLKAEQPTETYTDFKNAVLNEIARTLDMPFNIASGNSAGYNYASGRLDHQAFFRFVQIEQSVLESVVLDRLFGAWLAEASRITGYLPQAARTAEAPDHQWFWDGLEHVDPAKEANAQATKIATGTTTLAAECAKAGRDWEEVMRQRKIEIDLARELNIPLSPAVAVSIATEGRDEEDEK